MTRSGPRTRKGTVAMLAREWFEAAGKLEGPVSEAREVNSRAGKRFRSSKPEVCVHSRRRQA